ncbi:MAG: DUF4190 domain-containing protein [Phycisphaerales bacterium]|nr:DUF4190 domain-containing protein [Phycisphaerales bacterium]
MYCTSCGTQINHDAKFCSDCGYPTDPNAASAAQSRSVEAIENDLKYLIPMGTSPIPMIAGYLGLFSILVFPAPFALIFGVVGLKQLKNKNITNGKGRCWTGIILGSIFTALPIVLYAIS